MYKHVFTILIVFSSINAIYSQNRAIQGKVIYDNYNDFDPIPYADIIINDSIKIGRTGIDGCFQFETSLPVNKLTISSVGVEDADLIISDNCNNIELIMISLPHRCFMSLRKINKERRKIYKNLPRLHKEAYEKGIFQSPDVCYIQEFYEFE